MIAMTKKYAGKNLHLMPNIVLLELLKEKEENKSGIVTKDNIEYAWKRARVLDRSESCYSDAEVGDIVWCHYTSYDHSNLTVNGKDCLFMNEANIFGKEIGDRIKPINTWIFLDEISEQEEKNIRSKKSIFGLPSKKSAIYSPLATDDVHIRKISDISDQLNHKNMTIGDFVLYGNKAQTDFFHLKDTHVLDYSRILLIYR